MDLQVLAESLELDQETTRRLLQTFVTATEGDLAQMRQALASGQSERVAELAHHIKGAAANLELEAMRAASFELETSAKAGNLEGGDTTTATLTTELAKLQTVLG